MTIRNTALLLLSLCLLASSALAEEGEDALKLKVDELVFGGIAFLEATPAACVEAFGTPVQQTDEVAGVMELVYDEGELLIEFTQEGTEWQLSAVRVADSAIAGPRGLQTDDAQQSVFDRFGMEDSEDGLMYTCEDEEGNSYALVCVFEEEVLTEYQLYRI